MSSVYLQMMKENARPGRVIPGWTLGDRLRKAREEFGASQADMAELLEISTRAISNYEACNEATMAGRRPPRHVILGWSVATQIDPEWLETGSVTPPGGGGDSEECPRQDSNLRPRDHNPHRHLAAPLRAVS